MKSMDYFRKDVVKIFFTAIVFTVVVGFIVSIFNETYAVTSYTIIFNRNNNTEVMKTCQTDENGKLDEDCLSTIASICKKWSPYHKYSPEGQINQVLAGDFANMTFDKDTNYYCVGGTSGSYSMGCYVCNTDETIMHWAASGSANEFCESGYTKSETILEEESCKVVIPDSCFVCNDDDNVMKWDNNGDADNQCSSGYTSIAKPKNECVTIIPDSCFVCNNNENVMKWDNNGDADNQCSSGYTSTLKPQNECVTIIPNSCFVCNNDDNVMKWDNNGDADDKCAEGYTKIDNITNEENCKVENPKTGNILISLVWFIGMFAFGYIVYYCKNLKD